MQDQEPEPLPRLSPITSHLRSLSFICGRERAKHHRQLQTTASYSTRLLQVGGSWPCQFASYLCLLCTIGPFLHALCSRLRRVGCLLSTFFRPEIRIVNSPILPSCIAVHALWHPQTLLIRTFSEFPDDESCPRINFLPVTGSLFHVYTCTCVEGGIGPRSFPARPSNTRARCTFFFAHVVFLLLRVVVVVAAELFLHNLSFKGLITPGVFHCAAWACLTLH